MDFKSLVAQDQRLVILRTLSEDGDYQHNEYVLQSALGMFGHALSQDALRTHLSWLEEQGLITLATPNDVYVAKLTTRGNDVALGRAIVPGVKRPMPGVL